jgi:hypothetical protein
VGEKLYEIGDATYPFIALLEGEVHIHRHLDADSCMHCAAAHPGQSARIAGLQYKCPRQESNLDLPLRRRSSYPLDYEGAPVTLIRLPASTSTP